MTKEYNSDKDEIINERTIYLGENKFIEISTRRYDKGEPKIQITRYSQNHDGTKKEYKKLGRLTSWEFKELLREMKEYEVR